MDKILKENIFASPASKPKKVNYAEHCFDFVKNFVAPNKRTYQIMPEKSNNERLNNFIHANLLMNNLINPNEFYKRNLFYRANSVAYIAEFFCRDFGFDGIFVQGVPAHEKKEKMFRIDEDKTVIYFYDERTFLDKSVKQPEKVLCDTIMASLKMLGIMKQFENASHFLKGIDVSPYTAFISYFRLMLTTLEEHGKALGKIYLPPRQHLLTFDAFYYGVDALDNYFETLATELASDNMRMLVSSALNYYSYFGLGTKNSPLTLDILLKNCDKIKSDYRVRFGRGEIAKNVLNGVVAYPSAMIEKSFIERQRKIEKFVVKYSDWYLDSTKNLDSQFIIFIKDIIEINGYAYITYLIDAVYMLSSFNLEGCEHYLNLYNQFYEQSNLDIIESISQLDPTYANFFDKIKKAQKTKKCEDE